jgi:hypothetical protein
MSPIPPLGPIGPYLERYHEERTQGLDEWEVFWDYKCTIERNGERILDEARRAETAARLVSYLFFYGMGRGSTRLLDIKSSRRFAAVLRGLSSPAAADLFAVSFTEAVWSQKPFVSVWEDLGEALRQIAVSDSAIMRSKILLAVWGEMPAFDTQFANTFKATYGFLSGKPHKMLNRLREAYLATWQSEIRDVPEPWRLTAGGNRIPDARLLDIAFWYHGKTQSNTDT